MTGPIPADSEQVQPDYLGAAALATLYPEVSARYEADGQGPTELAFILAYIERARQKHNTPVYSDDELASFVTNPHCFRRHPPGTSVCLDTVMMDLVALGIDPDHSVEEDMNQRLSLLLSNVLLVRHYHLEDDPPEVRRSIIFGELDDWDFGRRDEGLPPATMEESRAHLMSLDRY